MAAIIVGVILFLATMLFWLITVQFSLSQHGSDAAGNGMSRAFAALAGIMLWIFLILLLLVGAASGEMPGWSEAIAVILVPASGVVAGMAIHFLGKERKPKWPIIVPLVVPGLLIAYSVWCFFPSIHSATGVIWPGIVVWGAVLMLLPVPWVAKVQRTRAWEAIPQKTPEEIAQEEALAKEEHRRQVAESFHQLTPDSPLQEWWSYTAAGNEFRREALEGARRAKNRQSEAIAMLAEGPKSLFLALPQLDLQVTPELEKAVRAYLLDQVNRLMPYSPEGSITTKIVTEWYEDYLPAIQWLIANHGNCNDALTALAAAVTKYPNCEERQKFLATLQSFQTTGK